MEAKEVWHIMRGLFPSSTLEDAAAFLGLCHERGLTPFLEASPIVTDYDKRDGTHVHSVTVKEHYSVMERWAQQCGGYTVRLREVERDQDGNIRARVGIVSNRDYAAVGQFCARVPGVDFRQELEAFMTIGEAILTVDETGKKQPPKGKTWQWLAEKRARESALLQKFGREPSQSRKIYTAAVAGQLTAAQANALLYGEEAPALPAPSKPASVPATAPAPATVEAVVEPEPEPEPKQGQRHWVDDLQSRNRFWANARALGLNPMDVTAALGVVTIREYTGTVENALEVLTRYAKEGASGG